MDLHSLVTEHATLVVAALVGVMVLMRLILAVVPPASVPSRVILWFWHPEARKLNQAPSAELHALTLHNMNGTLLALATVFLLIRPAVVQASYIPSQSMEPTLIGRPDGRQDRVLVNKYLFNLRPPQRGEILVFQPPKGAVDGHPDDDLIKRLIGLPGDVVEVRNHHAYINHVKLDEPYLASNVDTVGGRLANYGPVTVPPGKYFMMGDNRGNSSDSRVWGFADADSIRGKAMCVFWPLVARDPNDPDGGRHVTAKLLP